MISKTPPNFSLTYKFIKTLPIEGLALTTEVRPKQEMFSQSLCVHARS